MTLLLGIGICPCQIEEFACMSLFFLIVCFTGYFVFQIVVLPHSPGGSVLPSIVERPEFRGLPSSLFE